MQLELLKAVAAAGQRNGVPVVVVSVSSGMLDLQWAKQPEVWVSMWYALVLF